MADRALERAVRRQHRLRNRRLYDNFLKNRNLYFAALQHYYKMGYTYIELGDGDELWENRGMRQIIEAHGDVFQLLSRFIPENALSPGSMDIYLTHGHQADLFNSTLWRLSRPLPGGFLLLQ